MLLSIIIPIYNREDKIERCINSLQRIKKRNVEFVLVNDGSTDNTKVVCEEWAQKETRIRLINQENTGVSGARNAGIKNSRGKYIAFVDSDDEITEAYNIIINHLEENDKYDLYAFDFFIQMEKNPRRHKRELLLAGKNEKEVLYNNYLTGDTNSACMNIYRAEIMKANDIYFPVDMKMGEDAVFNGRYLKYCNNVYYIDEIGYKYYLDDGNASYAYRLSYLQDFPKIYDMYLEIYRSCDGLKYPNCAKYHVDNIYGILKRHWKSMAKEEKKAFRRSAFCKKLLLQNYGSWKHEIKKCYVFVILYLSWSF